MSEIHIGMSGWTYEPWRGEFYPKGLPQRRELEYASRQVNSIEINGTFYGTQKPASFRNWAAATPDSKPRDVFTYFDNAPKTRAPFDAISLADRFGIEPDDGMDFSKKHLSRE